LSIRKPQGKSIFYFSLHLAGELINLKIKPNVEGYNMPWIDKEICTGCEICLDKCPVDAIVMVESKAYIDMDGCIRCAVCHDICPLDAVKHDSERVDEWVEEKIQLALKNRDLCEELLGSAQDAKKCLDRTIKSYKRDELVLQKAIEKLEDIYDTL